VPCGLADQDTVTFLKQFWRQLDDEHIAVGLHYFVDGMSHAEVARVVGCSPRTVGNRIARLRALANEAAAHPKGAVQ
jgi:RNA polymerase sigma-70 factor (ECF subfamily)